MSDGAPPPFEQTPAWLALVRDIESAFAAVRLSNGIGYHEAGARDDWLKPDDPAYQARRALDDRDDWHTLLREFDSRDMDLARFCFMDAEGLRFFLPVLLLRRDDVIDRIMLDMLCHTEHPRAERPSACAQLLPLLDRAQKDSLLAFYRLRASTDRADFWTSNQPATFEDGEAVLLPRLRALLADSLPDCAAAAHGGAQWQGQ